jgi:hypothetical protein
LFYIPLVLECDLDLALPHAFIDGLSIGSYLSKLLIWSSGVLVFASRRQIAYSGQQGTVGLHQPYTGHHDEA